MLVLALALRTLEAFAWLVISVLGKFVVLVIEVIVFYWGSPNKRNCLRTAV